MCVGVCGYVCSPGAEERGRKRPNICLHLYQWVQAWMHKGTDNQTFNPINVARQQNELNKSGGAAPDTMLPLLLLSNDAQLVSRDTKK